MLRFFEMVRDAENQRFLMWYDSWANNIMYNETDTDCLLIDWQFLSTGPPFLDFSNIAFMNMNPKDTEENMDKMLSSFYERSAIRIGSFLCKLF